MFYFTRSDQLVLDCNYDIAMYIRAYRLCLALIVETLKPTNMFLITHDCSMHE